MSSQRCPFCRYVNDAHANLCSICEGMMTGSVFPPRNLSVCRSCGRAATGGQCTYCRADDDIFSSAAQRMFPTRRNGGRPDDGLTILYNIIEGAHRASASASLTPTTPTTTTTTTSTRAGPSRIRADMRAVSRPAVRIELGMPATELEQDSQHRGPVIQQQQQQQQQQEPHRSFSMWTSNPFLFGPQLFQDPQFYDPGAFLLEEALVQALMGETEDDLPPPPAADPDAMRRFMKLVRDVSPDAVCCVCLDKFGDREATELPCGHQYHEACVLPWFESHDTCPTCRDSLNSHLESTRESA
jgi:hypothetical protein